MLVVYLWLTQAGVTHHNITLFKSNTAHQSLICANVVTDIVHVNSNTAAMRALPCTNEIAVGNNS